MGLLSISPIGEMFSDVRLLFYMDRETSVPTWFATILLFCLFGMATFIAIISTFVQNVYAARWRWLSFIFLLMSVEEVAGFREAFITPQLRELFDLSGIFFFGWVIPIGALTLIFIGVYAEFIWKLPKNIRNFFAVGMTIYIVGAIGIELISAYVIAEDSILTLERGAIYNRVTFVEEVFEFTGAIMMLHALLLYTFHYTLPTIREIEITNSAKWLQVWFVYRRDVLIITTILLIGLFALLIIH